MNVALLEHCLLLDNLERALKSVVDNDAEDGAPTPGVQRLLNSGTAGLQLLADEVRSQTYRPQALIAIDIPKRDGSLRRLAIPSARDRVLERAVLQTIGRIVDAHLGSASYAYRNGVSLGDAVRAVVRYRDDGFSWVARTDIHDCFDSINREMVRRKLSVVLGDETAMLDLIDLLLERPIRVGRRLLRPARGVPQGCALSPMFANLILQTIDERVYAQGFPIVRYADDLVVFGRTRNEARKALAVVEEAAADIGLATGQDKTEVVDFASGFCFLGEDFSHRYPPTATDPVEVAARKVLYVGTQGAFVALRQGRVVVLRDKVELLSAPSGHVERIVVFGGVTLSPAVLGWAIQHDADVVWCSRRGFLNGMLTPGSTSSAALHRTQYAKADDSAWSLAVAKAFIRGKIHNQRVLLLRRVIPDEARPLREATEQLALYASMVDDVQTREELLGVEGIAARVYFTALRAILDPALGFTQRAKRPPPDVVNAALGYGYAVLFGECATSLVAAGLDPTIGLLHVEQTQRSSLALDLAEEFRPVIVDATVVSMARSDALATHHGRPAPNGEGVWLTEDGKRSLIAAVERRLLTKVHHVGVDRKVSYRRAIQLQAMALRRRYVDADDEYMPMLWRV